MAPADRATLARATLRLLIAEARDAGALADYANRAATELGEYENGTFVTLTDSDHEELDLAIDALLED